MRIHDRSDADPRPRAMPEATAAVPGRPRSTQEIADGGVAGTCRALPHLESIQRAFGRHDVSAIRAHVGGAARDAARAIGAEAYATGDAVAFQSAPTLHVAAHEAAHVIQQRAGVHCRGGGDGDDMLERHADEVADRVVQGGSAEALLDRVTALGGGPDRAVQRLRLDRGGAPIADPAASARDEVHDTASRDGFDAWLRRLAIQGDAGVRTLERVRDALLATKQPADHEAAALVQTQQHLLHARFGTRAAPRTSVEAWWRQHRVGGGAADQDLATGGNTDLVAGKRDRLGGRASTDPRDAVQLSWLQRLLDRAEPAPPVPKAGAQIRLDHLPRSEWWRVAIAGEQHVADDPYLDTDAMHADLGPAPGYYHATTRALATWVAASDRQPLTYDRYAAMHRDVVAHTFRGGPEGYEPTPGGLAPRGAEHAMTGGEFPNPDALVELLDRRVLGRAADPERELRRPVEPPVRRRMRLLLDGGEDAREDRRRKHAERERRSPRARREATDQLRASLARDHEEGRIVSTRGRRADLDDVLDVTYAGQHGDHEYGCLLRDDADRETGRTRLTVVNHRDPATVPAEVDRLFAAYYATMADIERRHGPRDQEAKRTEQLRAIAGLVRTLQVRHCFEDGNTRLHAVVLLNRLLADAGLDAAAVAFPRRFGEGFTVTQLIEQILAGQAMFLAHLADARRPPPAP